jgi:hypothetical protein
VSGFWLNNDYFLFAGEGAEIGDCSYGTKAKPTTLIGSIRWTGSLSDLLGRSWLANLSTRTNPFPPAHATGVPHRADNLDTDRQRPSLLPTDDLVA